MYIHTTNNNNNDTRNTQLGNQKCTPIVWSRDIGQLRPITAPTPFLWFLWWWHELHYTPRIRTKFGDRVYFLSNRTFRHLTLSLNISVLLPTSTVLNVASRLIVLTLILIPPIDSVMLVVGRTINYFNNDNNNHNNNRSCIRYQQPGTRSPRIMYQQSAINNLLAPKPTPKPSPNHTLILPLPLP